MQYVGIEVHMDKGQSQGQRLRSVGSLKRQGGGNPGVGGVEGKRNTQMPLAASAVFILNSKGDSIIHRVYRDEMERNYADAFRTQVLANEDATPKPVQQVGESTFMYTRVNNLFVVLATKANANVASAFKFLHDMVDVFKYAICLFTKLQWFCLCS